MDRSAFRRRVLHWFKTHARDLPWRRTQDAYAIWISEVMLQQTQVATVVPYYDRFLKRFPDVVTLANAPLDDVLRLWEGLGYYRRAKQLHAAAQVIREQHDGIFPRDVQTVLTLPGIGRYTAGAILSIAEDQRLPILEGNTIRVYSRLLAYRDDPRSRSGQQVLWQFAEDILPRKRVGQFNQAMMELGSEVCVLRDPHCSQCPVMRWCPTRENGLQDQIPLSTRKINYQPLQESAVVVSRGERCLIRLCRDGERWAGLWDFPRVPVNHDGATSAGIDKRAIEHAVHRLTGIRIAVGQRLATIKHAVTRYRITLTCFDAAYTSGRQRAGEDCRWVTPAELQDYPLSATGRRLAKLTAEVVAKNGKH